MTPGERASLTAGVHLHAANVVRKHEKYQRSGNSSIGKRIGTESRADLSVTQFQTYVAPRAEVLALGKRPTSATELISHIQSASHQFRTVVLQTIASSRKAKKKERKQALRVLGSSLRAIAVVHEK